MDTVYRNFNGETIALWPAIMADMNGHCQSYLHCGQHGTADFNHVMQNSEPADNIDKEILRKELLDIGYSQNEC